MLEDVLYQLSERDLQGPLMMPWFRTKTVNLAVASSVVTVNLGGDFAADQLVIVSSIGAVITPAGGSVPVDMRCSWFPRANASVLLLGHVFPNIGLGVARGFARNVRYVLTPNPSFQFDLSFTTSDLHGVTASLSGWTIPRANVSSA